MVKVSPLDEVLGRLRRRGWMWDWENVGVTGASETPMSGMVMLVKEREFGVEVS